MKLSELKLGQKVYIVKNKEIREGYLISLKSAPTRLITRLKLPKLRLVYQFIYQTIQQILTDRDYTVLKYINIKPIFLLLLKRYTDTSLSDLASFFSVYAKVAVKSKTGGTELVEVVASKVYLTRAAAAARNLETGKYCYICGTEFLRNENPPILPLAPCKKCKKSIERTMKVITSFLPFSDSLFPPNGLRLSGSVMEGKIYYPYKTATDIERYKELVNNPDWNLEDVDMDSEANILGATFSTRKLLKLSTHYKDKDYRHPHLRKVLMNYQSFLLNGTYNKPILRIGDSYNNIEDADIERVFSTYTITASYEVFLEDNKNVLIPLEKITYINDEQFESSIPVVEKSGRTYLRLGMTFIPTAGFDRTTVKVSIERVGNVRELLTIRELNTDRKTYLTLLETSELPSGIIGIYVESVNITPTETIERTDKFYFKTTDQEKDFTEYPSQFVISRPNFFSLINDKIFYSKLPLKDILVTYLPVDPSYIGRVTLKINGKIIQQLNFNSSLSYPVIPYTEIMDIPLEDRWKYLVLSDIHYDTIKNYISEETFGINKLDIEFWENNERLSLQRAYFRITNNSATFVDGVESLMDSFTPHKDYANTVYELKTRLVISHLKRPFKLKYVIIDFYDTPPKDRTSETPLYRSVIAVDKTSTVYNHLNNVNTLLTELSIPTRSLDYEHGRINEGTYYVIATALLQYAEDMDAVIPRENFVLTEAGHPIGLWNNVNIIATKFNIPERPSTDVVSVNIDNNDPYTNLIKDNGTLVNFVINKYQLAQITDKLAFITGRRTEDIDTDTTNFATALVNSISNLTSPLLHSPKMGTISLGSDIDILIKTYDKHKWYTDGEVIQAVYTPNVEYTIEEVLNHSFLLSDIRDNLNLQPGYKNFSIELLETPVIDNTERNAVVFLRIIPVNLAATKYSIADKVFFTKRIGAISSPVHSVHSGSLEEISLRLPAVLPPFKFIESTLYSSGGTLEASVLSSLVPKFGVDNPPDLPMDVLKIYKVNSEHLFSRYDDAKNNALWMFCLFCRRFKPTLPKDITFKEAGQFAEFVLTGEVDDERSKIPEEFRSISNLREYSTELSRKITFNSKLKEAYRGISKENLVLALKVKREGDIKLSDTDYNRFRRSLDYEEDYLKNINKNLFTSDYALEQAGESRDPFAKNMGDWPGKELENLALDPRDSVLDRNSPTITNVFPDSSARVEFLLRQLGYSIDQLPKTLIGGIGPLNNLIEKIEHSQRINNMKLDELRSKLNFGIIDLGSLLGDELASHVGFCAECQGKLQNELIDTLRKISNFLLGFPIDSTREVRFYSIDYIDVEFYNDTTDYSKYDFVLPLNSLSKEAEYLKTEISKQLEKL